jgi:hypothetical protein
MAGFKPDERQQRLIDEALVAHRSEQANGRYAPQRLIRKWCAESLGSRPLQLNQTRGGYVRGDYLAPLSKSPIECEDVYCGIDDGPSRIELDSHQTV